MLCGNMSANNFQITTFWNIDEPLSLSNRLYNALLNAGWQYVKPDHGLALFGNLEGIEIYVHPQAGPGTKAAADALVSALNADGLSAIRKDKNAPNNPDELINLNIGTKPILAQ